MLFVLFVVFGFGVAPQGASALSMTPSLGSPITIASPNDVVSHATVADFDGNGNADVATVGSNNKQINVFLTDAEGVGFASVGPIGSGSANDRISVFAGQFGGDSAIDLVSLTYAYPRQLETYIGNGDGTFPSTPTSTYTFPESSGSNYPTVIGTGVVGDVNDDGWDDFAVGMNYHTFSVALGSSTGQFGTAGNSPVQIPITGASNGAALTPSAMGDWDGDGDLDLAFGVDDNNNSLPGVYVASNDGLANGTFTPSGTPVLTQGAYEWPSSIATVDLNGDAADDLAVATANRSEVTTLLGGPTGLAPNPNASGTFSAPNYPYALSVADFDKDGNEDIAVGNRSGRNVTVLKSGGDGTLTEAPGSPFGLPAINGKNFSVNTLHTGDINGDGAPDLAATSSHSGDPNQARGVDVLINRPQVELSTDFIEFPATRLNQTATQQVVIVKNTGAPPVDLEEIDISGSGEGQFAVSGTDCPSVIPSGTQCGIGVTFTPTAYGTPSASLDIGFADIFNTSVALLGNTPPYMDFVPPMGLEFGEVTSGYEPAAKTETIVIYSGGGADLELGAPQITGPDADDYVIENPDACANPLPFGSNCALDVTFAPPMDSGGFREAYVSFETDNDPEDNQPIPLAGYAIRAEFSVTPGSFDFGEAKIDPTTPRTAQTFTLDSTGPADVVFNKLELTGPDADSFKIMSNDCPETIDAHDGTCTFSVVFDPTYGSAGTRNATLQVDAFSSVKPGPTAVALTGTATSDPIPPVGKPKLTLKLKSAGKVKRGKTLIVTATVKNTGNAPAKPLTIKATVPKKFAKAPKAIKVASLAPGKSVTRKLKIKVKKTAKKGKKLAVKVTASSGTVKKTANRSVKVR